MSDLSVFIDESGDFGPDSKYYVLALVLHDQTHDVEDAIRNYESSLVQRPLSDIPFHFNPLLRANGFHEGLDASSRMKHLMSFKIFADNVSFRYRAFIFEKSRYNDAEALSLKMKRELVNFLFDHLEEFQAFRHVKLYYDDGQRQLTKTLHQAFEYALGIRSLVYRNASPYNYRLSQIADYVCGIELTARKYERHDERPSDTLFFGTTRDFKKTFLKKLRKKQI